MNSISGITPNVFRMRSPEFPAPIQFVPGDLLFLKQILAAQRQQKNLSDRDCQEVDRLLNLISHAEGKR